MRKKFKHALSIFGAGAVGLAVLTQAGNAATISGSISFNGNVTALSGVNGTGVPVTDYGLARSLIFGETFVSSGATGSFSSVTQNSLVNMYSPVDVNPPALPGSGAAIWVTQVGGFSLTLSSLTEDAVVSPFNTLTLRGDGVVSDGDTADNSEGEWVATFTLADSTSGISYSWNASFSTDSSSPPPVMVADGGFTLILLGCGMTGLGLYGRKMAH